MIAILMATYNGEKYIEEQIESLLGQTVQDFVVHIHDDCSTDNTYSIIERYAHQYPDKFVVSRNEYNTGGAKHNFMQMMAQYKADYVMLCDQDDVWKPDKIEITFAKMQEIEKIQNFSCPILVHTDLEVVNSQLQTIAPSFVKMEHLNTGRTELNQALVQNVVTGCTAMYNRTLADLISECPNDIIMHDWWLLLIASAFGKTEFVSLATTLYRQHQENSVGAKATRTFSYIIKRLHNRSDIKYALAATYQQAERFSSAFEDRLLLKQKRLLQQYRAIVLQNKFMRIYNVLKLRTFKYGVARKTAQLMFL